MGRLSRHTATPDVAVMIDRIWSETDIRGILPSVSALTLLLAYDDAGDYVASLMPNAEVRLIQGSMERHRSDGHIREWLGFPRRTPISTACWRPCYSPTSLGPPNGSLNSATLRGVRSWPATMSVRRSRSSGTGAASSTPPATASSRRSMARPGRCGARWRS